MVAVEGLRPLIHGQYQVYGLLAKDGECRGISCGELTVNKQGHGEMAWDFDPDALGSGYTVEDLFGVTVATETGNSLSAPLTAYVGEKRQWRALFSPLEEEPVLQAAEMAVLERPVVEEKADKAKVIELPQKEPEPKEERKAEKSETIQQSAPAKEQPDFSYHGNFRGLLKKFRQEMAELEEMGILTAEESARILGKSLWKLQRTERTAGRFP